MRFFSHLSFLILLIWITAYKNAYANDTIQFKIEWQAPVPSWFSSDSATGKYLLSFKNSKYNLNGIPEYSQLLPLESNCSEISIEIISADFDTIPIPLNLSHIEDIPVELIFSASILKESKTNRAQISFIPVIRKNNQLLLLKKASFRVVKTLTFLSTKKNASERWKSASVLNSGVWKKIAVEKTGVYKLTYAEIKTLGFSNPSEIKLFGNGGTMLSEKFTDNNLDDLVEIPIYQEKGSDGIFNEGDYILFYATGPITWTFDGVNKKFIHSKHLYSNKTYYFLTSGSDGLKIADAGNVDQPQDVTITSFVDYDVHEDNLFNLIASGRNWVGERFALQASRSFTFTFPDPLENSLVTLEGEVLGRSDINTSFYIKYNNQTIVNQSISRVYKDDETSNYADLKSFTAKPVITGKDVSVNITYDNKGDNSADGWLNYLRLNVKRKLWFSTDFLYFRDTSALFQNKTALYTIENAKSGLLLWEVSDINHTKNIPYQLTGQQLSFKSKTDSLRNFVLFDPSKVSSPDLLTANENIVENQNLHALANVQMVIISHKDFLPEAEELDEIHRNNDGLSVVTITPEQIYNEFSSGSPDPAAYRNFMKMLYDKATKPEEMPKYLLLFGDGSYKNLSDKASENNSNFILTYQSANSLRPVSSYVSDDYFGLLDDNESIESGLLDIGIGRFPVSTAAQAQGVVNKIKKYISSSSAGSWRNDLCFIADDEDGNIHMSQADQLTTYIQKTFPTFNVKKLYSDAFPQIITSAGPRYPEVNKAITNTLNSGALIVNYTGHGGKEGLAVEQIIKHEEVNSWRNTLFPLFVTATCEFSRYDDYEVTTAGEDVLLNENGGGIGLLTTTRLVYSGPNFILNQEFYKCFAEKDSTGNYFRLGDILKKAKNASGTDINKLSFTLLGDPALQLAYPKFTVQTSEITSNDGLPVDTLSAYKEVTVKGMITDVSGNLASDFNGMVYPSLYDKEQTVKTLNNDNGDPFMFKQQESLLYKGKVTVRNGEFQFSFVMPREIAYNFGNGKLSYYASSNNKDAAGYFDQFTIGGISTENNTDTEGPNIHLYLNTTDFSNGGITNSLPYLLAELSDNSGINISGTGIGHDIIGVLDNNTSNSFVLNNYFESEIDNYKNGSIWYKLPKLEVGKHTLSLKAWDIFNNSTTSEIVFEVADTSMLRIKNLQNYPNPFSTSTTFVFEHNQPGKTLDAELQVFNVTGNMVNSERMYIQNDGFTSGPIYWDAKTNYYKKLERGIYFYRFVFRYNGTEIVSESKKMVVSE